ncbi:hypothetical protein [Agromyces salentinus]|uniref:SnoaL-like domain-containing protein n=1 Tax=Agromyces salentinus TaxID=269421 RepID=A0ABN2MF85_9MICO|nr:hypothetical protein [Agromyces salentinus]
MPQADLPARLRAALHHGDELALASVLHHDVSLVADSGDDSGGELRGRARVIRAFHELQRRHPDASFRTAHVNGQPGLTFRRRTGQVVAVLGVDGRTAIVRLWLCTAPPKLAGWNRHRPEAD